MKTLRDQIKALEKQIILETVEACGGNQSEAARRLGVDRNSMRKRLRAIMKMNLGDE